MIQKVYISLCYYSYTFDIDLQHHLALFFNCFGFETLLCSFHFTNQYFHLQIRLSKNLHRYNYQVQCSLIIDFKIFIPFNNGQKILQAYYQLHLNFIINYFSFIIVNIIIIKFDLIYFFHINFKIEIVKNLQKLQNLLPKSYKFMKEICCYNFKFKTNDQILNFLYQYQIIRTLLNFLLEYQIITILLISHR